MNHQSVPRSRRVAVATDRAEKLAGRNGGVQLATRNNNANPQRSTTQNGRRQFELQIGGLRVAGTFGDVVQRGPISTVGRHVQTIVVAGDVNMHVDVNRPGGGGSGELVSVKDFTVDVIIDRRPIATIKSIGRLGPNPGAANAKQMPSVISIEIV